RIAELSKHHWSTVGGAAAGFVNEPAAAYFYSNFTPRHHMIPPAAPFFLPEGCIPWFVAVSRCVLDGWPGRGRSSLWNRTSTAPVMRGVVCESRGCELFLFCPFTTAWMPSQS